MTYDEIIIDFNSGKITLKEAVFLLIFKISRVSLDELTRLPLSIEDEFINILDTNENGHIETYSSSGGIRNVDAKEIYEILDKHFVKTRGRTIKQIKMENQAK
jgi:hypothetical protein